MGTVDLQQLAVKREPKSRQGPSRRRHLLTRYVLPLAVLCSFVAVLAWATGASLLPAKSVTVMPVIVARAEVQQAGAPLFQSAGWVEPRPGPMLVTALAEGVIEKMHVIEGQEVKAGDVIAELVTTDARLALEQADAEVKLRRADLATARATFKGASESFAQPSQLEADLAQGQALLAKAKTELQNLPYSIKVIDSRLRLAGQDLQGKKRAGDAIAGRALQKAQHEYESAQAALEELRNREPGLKEEVQFLTRRCDALKRQLDLKTQQSQGKAEAEAAVEAAAARLEQAELKVRAAQLRLDRMIIRAPADARVLERVSQVGRRVMGQDPAATYDASTVVTLYDPSNLQIRADVRLEDVKQVVIGQPVEIQSAAAQELLRGNVLAITSKADEQKNTLAVKVGIKNPPAVLKPNMLVQVSFIAPETPNAKSDSSARQLRLLVPRPLVISGEGGSTIWVADRRHGLARKTSVQLGRAGTHELVEVVEGLTTTDKLIVAGRENLEDGERIKVMGEDTTMGQTVSPDSGQQGDDASGDISK